MGPHKAISMAHSCSFALSFSVLLKESLLDNPTMIYADDTTSLLTAISLRASQSILSGGNVLNKFTFLEF